MPNCSAKNLLMLAVLSLLTTATVSSASADEPKDKKPTAAPADTPPEKPAEFRPPFPQREELFLPPAPKALPPKREDLRADIALKGFINVDGPRVLMQINGKVVPLKAGQQHGGVTIVAIEPPQVILQRGRIRWTESLAPQPQSPPRSATK